MAEPISYDSGAFKTVKIYEKHVVKSLKDNDGEGYGYSDYGTSTEEQAEELYREVQMMKKYKHLPIIPKLIWEDLENDTFAAERVYKIGEHPSRNTNNFDKRNKANIEIIYKAVYKKITNYGIKTNLSQVKDEFRIKSIIRCGLYHKLPVSNIIEDIATMIRLHKTTHLLQDMHSTNYGVKNGHIVLIDLGQVDNNGSGRKQVRERIVNSSHRTTAPKELELDYIKILGAKNDQRPIVLKNKYGNVKLEKFDKIQVLYNSIRIFLGNDILNISEEAWRVV